MRGVTPENLSEVKNANDDYRLSVTSNEILLSKSARQCFGDQLSEIVREIRGFSDFKEKTDWMRDHSKGVFEIDGRQLCFSVECLDTNKLSNGLIWSSPDAANAQLTTRFLVVSLLGE